LRFIYLFITQLLAFVRREETRKSAKCCIDAENFSVSDVETLVVANASVFRGNEKEKIRKWLQKTPDPRLHFAMARGIRSSPFFRVYTAANFSNELTNVTVDYLELLVRIESQKKEILLPALFEQRIADFGKSPDLLLQWLQPHLFGSSKLRESSELLFKDKPNAAIRFDYDPQLSAFCIRVGQ